MRPSTFSKDCTPTRNCTPTRSCDFQANHDTRDCSGWCVIPNVFTGGCSVRGNNPSCEAAKATQNKIYEADYALKLDCERLKSQEKLQCEAEKAGRKH